MRGEAQALHTGPGRQAVLAIGPGKEIEVMRLTGIQSNRRSQNSTNLRSGKLGSAKLEPGSLDRTLGRGRDRIGRLGLLAALTMGARVLVPDGAAAGQSDERRSDPIPQLYERPKPVPRARSIAAPTPAPAGSPAGTPAPAA